MAISRLATATKYGLAVLVGIGAGYWVPSMRGTASLQFALSDQPIMRTRLACKGVAEARLLRLPGTNHVTAEISASDEEAFLDLNSDGESLSFLTGGGVKAGHREGERHRTVGRSGSTMLTYASSASELNSLAFDKETGHLMWIKNGGLFRDSAFAIYLHCH